MYIYAIWNFWQIKRSNHNNLKGAAKTLDYNLHTVLTYAAVVLICIPKNDSTYHITVLTKSVKSNIYTQSGNISRK